MSSRIPVIVVSGFLGSGKTTFLRYLLKNANKKFGLLINEFGDVGIDGDLLKSCLDCEERPDKCVIELNNGCLCCTVQDDFIPSIQALLKSNSDIEIIFIETSGLALPIPLLKALNWPDIRTLIYLDMVIGIVNGESMLNDSPINNLKDINLQQENIKIIEHNSSIDELFNEQLEVSDLVIISRADLLNDEQYILVKEKIKDKIKKNIPIIKSVNGQIKLDYIFDSKIEKNNYQNYLSNEHNHSHPQVFSEYLRSNYFLYKEDFQIEMRKIINEVNILRIKGRLWIPGKVLPLQIQIVGSKVNTWFEDAPADCWSPKEGGGLEIVMIGQDRESFETVKRKIKEKFNISGDPKMCF